jgi:excisionase family DNA binding protein
VLIRPSQLARFWELHPRTVHGWIRQGRLAAIRSPGNHFRVPVADVRAFCEREGMPVPPFVSPPARRVIVAAAPEPVRRAVARALKGAVAIALEAFDDPYDALLAAATGPTAILVLATTAGARFDAAAAVRALGRARPTAGTAVVVVGAATRAQASAIEAAGAARAILRSRAADVPAALRELLGLGAA